MESSTVNQPIKIPLVDIIMGSTSDWDTMRPAALTLNELAIPHECRIVSAHRTPDRMFDYTRNAKEQGFL